MNGWHDFQGINAGYVAELYDRFRQDPASVDAATRDLFARRGAPPTTADTGAPRVDAPHPSAPEAARAIVGAVMLADAIRKYGHLAAQLDPLGGAPTGDPTLDPAAHGITEADLERLPADLVGGPAAVGAANAREAIARLRDIYCSTTGYDIAQIFVPAEREWLRHAAESKRFWPPNSPFDGVYLLDRITEVEVFERFLQRTFPGKTRFSIEGLDMMVPMLEVILENAAAAGTKHVLIGMAHRGRLNVLAHVMRKAYAQILAEFKDPIKKRTGYRIDLGWTGDVKYHWGGRTRLSDDVSGLDVAMAPNPSHLEAVNPVVAGMARAAGTKVDHRGAPTFDPLVTLPLLIHGDAAFPGQGVVAETLNLSRLDGFDTGGTIHIIANNQLGFTANPDEVYSTSYASGLARGFKIPIVHVNADDPEACIAAARLAIAYRSTFNRDVLIDLVGYRRHGHNEGDEPGFTQPVLYQKVAGHPTVREQFARRLVAGGIVAAATPDAQVQHRMSLLEEALASLKPDEDLVEPVPAPAPAGAAGQIPTAVPLESLAAMNASLLERPEGFVQHKKLDRGRDRRRAMFDDPAARVIDWAAAEELAFASILADGIPVRLTGEDVGRGTFSHRHAVFTDIHTNARHVPLQHLAQARASFEVYNTALSEEAVIGFEFGYNVQAPRRLVIWEAQYGDFINGAQIMIDQFVTSARAKWGQTPSMVFLLPHGYEGQGPEHSSARPERFLQAAAGINLRLANCTTAAQYFHLLRRQALLLDTDPLPLFVLTPKSLLRHPLVASAPIEFAEGRFRRVIDDEEAQTRAAQVTRAILCSGKVYVDLVTSEQRATDRHVALIRVEQLYPFPAEQIDAALAGYKKLREIVWLQEEPANMGAWEFARTLVEPIAQARKLPLRYVGRPRSASPSEGSAAWHGLNQRALVAQAFEASAATPTSVVVTR